MGREFEVKLRVPSEQVLDRILADPELRAMALEEDRTLRMESTYFDTADRCLAARRWTLRRRRENDRSVVTVKTPAPGRARGESELADLVRQGLAPRCGASFTRVARMLRLPGGSLAELAADRGILTGGDRQERLLEVEVELKEGSEAEVETFAGKLCRRFGLAEEPLSKFARAARLAEG